MFRVIPLILLISCASRSHPKAAERLKAQRLEGISEPYQEIALDALVRAGRGDAPGVRASGAITAALTIVRSDKGMTWLKNNLPREDNPGRPGVWRYYYFWCLAMLAAVEKVRARLRALWPWPNDHHAVADTAFGLLALSNQAFCSLHPDKKWVRLPKSGTSGPT